MLVGLIYYLNTLTEFKEIGYVCLSFDAQSEVRWHL